jgi:hypothetical protein
MANLANITMSDALRHAGNCHSNPLADLPGKA